MMFSTNPFPQLASSTHVFPPSTSFLDHEKDDLFFVTGDCCFHSPATGKFTSCSKHDLIEGLGLEYCDEYNNLFVSEAYNPTKKKKASKKDHHSKIHTAQGTRDRRVRLSIDVARKFFYLQDLLGFDKASKTLDWLFTKSKVPIDELVKGEKQSEAVFMEGSNEQEQEQGQKKKSTTKKATRKYKSRSPVNQSRVDARARARERTKEKLHIKVHGDSCCSCCRSGSSSNSTLQSSFWSSMESQNERIGDLNMDENMSMLYNYQHSLSVSNDSSSNFTSLPTI